jgi:hypothetical protein
MPSAGVIAKPFEKGRFMSTEPHWKEETKQLFLTTTIINSGLVMGVVFFAIITIAIHEAEMTAGSGVLSVVAAVAALGAFPVSMLASRVVVQNGVKEYLQNRRRVQEAAEKAGHAPPDPQHFSLQNELAPLAKAYQSKLIVGSAILESAAFFTCVAYLIEKSYVPLIFLAALITALALRTPTPGKIIGFFENYIALGETDRHFPQ